MSANPAAYYKALRLGDTARSHPSPQVTIEGVDFQPTVAGNNSVVGERGAGSRVGIEIEAMLIRSYDQATGDIGAAEADGTFFARKLTLANNLRLYAGHKPTTANSRLGALVWVDDPASADKLAPSSFAGGGGFKFTINLSPTFGSNMADNERLLLINGDAWQILQLSSAYTAGGSTISFDSIADADFIGGSTLYRIRWMLADAALSGDFRVGEGDKASRVARGSTLRFDSVEDFWIRP
jgi:hypothetical protein